MSKDSISSFASFTAKLASGLGCIKFACTGRRSGCERGCAGVRRSLYGLFTETLISLNRYDLPTISRAHSSGDLCHHVPLHHSTSSKTWAKFEPCAASFWQQAWYTRHAYSRLVHDEIIYFEAVEAFEQTLAKGAVGPFWTQ